MFTWLHDKRSSYLIMVLVLVLAFLTLGCTGDYEDEDFEMYEREEEMLTELRHINENLEQIASREGIRLQPASLGSA